MKEAAKKAKEAFGEVNVACCNAGVCRLAPFEEMSDEMRDFHIDVNIKGVWNSCQAVIPYMLEQGGGSIVIDLIRHRGYRSRCRRSSLRYDKSSARWFNEMLGG